MKKGKPKDLKPHVVIFVEGDTDVVDDIEGLCTFLKLKEVPKNLNGNNGYAKLLSLFKRSGKVYTKGLSVEDFLDAINIEKIRNSRKAALADLELVLNVSIPKK